MAGRGTDILLGGSAEHMARQQCLSEDVAQKLERGQEKFVDDEEFVYFSHGDYYRVPRADWERIFSHFKRQCDAEHEEVVALGGLHILGTERHEARRIDNQLRGRAGRQGDPGSSRFYLSLEDDLMRIFGSDRISGLMQRLGMEEGVPIEHGMVTRAIERAQKQVEAQNFAVRKHLLEYDDVMNKQREHVYTLRRQVLEGRVQITETETGDTRDYLLATAQDLVDDRVELFLPKEGDRSSWDLDALRRELSELFAIDDDDYAHVAFDGRSSEIRDALWERVREKYEAKERMLPPDILRRVERDLMLQIVDTQWKDHLYSLDHLKDGISLRSYGQRDPLVEYKKESYQLFQDMRGRIEADMVRYLWWLRPVEGAPEPAPRPAPRRTAPLTYSGGGAPEPVPAGFPAPQPAVAAAGGFPAAARQPARVGGDDAPITTVKRDEPKIGRNDPCWCGSGKKYKKCHGAA
jgi:preprotein translocase subunit SecA